MLDCWVIIISLGSPFCLPYKEDTINLKSLSPDHPLISLTGEGVWLGAITLVESSFNELSYDWLWAGLFFILVVIICITSIFGYVEVIANSLISPSATCFRFKPLISLLTVLTLSLIGLVIATEGGIHIYYLLQTSLASWPLLLFTIITILTSVYSHGISYIVKDISSMCKTYLSHTISSHFTVIITTIAPVLISVSIIILYHLYPSMFFLRPVLAGPCTHYPWNTDRSLCRHLEYFSLLTGDRLWPGPWLLFLWHPFCVVRFGMFWSGLGVGAGGQR